MPSIVIALGLLVAGAPDHARAVNAGRHLFHDPGLGRTGVACAACHATVKDERREGDGLIRAGLTLWGVARRPYWRGDTQRQLHASLEDAVDVCVQLFQGGAPLEGRPRRQLAAYLKHISPRTKSRPRRSQTAGSPRIKTALEADLDYDRPKYRGGRPQRGRALFYRACHRCHPHGRAGIAPDIRGASVAEVAKAVREGNGLLRGARLPGAWSPSFGVDRLSHPQVADIAAYVGSLSKRE